MLEKTFDPAEAEPRIYAAWEASGAFKPRSDGEGAFCIVIPPPNVTGSLHIGHALNNTLQDILIRWARMRGLKTLWQPGTDHAGIATQMVVERQLMEAQLPSRQAMGREAFLERVWAWKETSGGTILGQLKRLGASCDWSRERFTMDEGLSAAVRKVFVELYKANLIYRDKRLVNWDPKFQTAISDLEVENIEVQGKMWRFAYPLDGRPVGGVSEIVIATTRPETMLGDGAVAVHPDDERYKRLIGRKVRLPLADRLIPVIADEYADPEKGSGAVKITGAHDFNDFEVAMRHGIALFEVMDERAQMAGPHVPARFRGLDRYAARDAIVAEMENLGLLRGVEDKPVMQPFGDRSGVVIEPRLTNQWFLDAKTMAKEAIAAVKDGRTKITPESWAKTYFHWMENIEPWCISRQLWWGHRIPAWFGPDGALFIEETEAEAYAAAEAHYGEPMVIIQDEDVLDTWFSSALWPFSTLGWPDETAELKTFYPTTTLVTAFDIIFFWVARMMMMGLHFMKEVPFRDVYIHALVRDETGAKMSKSKGNVVDPIDLIDAYGADALRFTLAALAAQGRDIRMSASRVEGYRNFGTKVWNAARFARMNGCVPVEGWEPASATLVVNRWIIGELVATARKVSEELAAYRFNEAAGALYRFAWNAYCDWYLELIKPVLQGGDAAAMAETRATAAWALDNLLRLLHPFIPFISEELWSKTASFDGRGGLLINERWPDLPESLIDAAAAAEVDWLIALVTEIRSARSDLDVAPSARPKAVLVGASETVAGWAARWREPILALARLEALDRAEAPPRGAVQAVVGEALLALDLRGVVDLAAVKARLGKEIARLNAEIARIDQKLANERFTANAPEEVVEAERDKRAGYAAEQAKLARARERLEEAG